MIFHFTQTPRAKCYQTPTLRATADFPVGAWALSRVTRDQSCHPLGEQPRGLAGLRQLRECSLLPKELSSLTSVLISCSGSDALSSRIFLKHSHGKIYPPLMHRVYPKPRNTQGDGWGRRRGRGCRSTPQSFLQFLPQGDLGSCPAHSRPAGSQLFQR